VITINMDRARELWLARLRADRAPQLAALDIDFMRALGAGAADQLAQVEQRKQALRDVTAHPALTAAHTSDALKALDLAALLG
jgi:hypothetical protein